jgi:hypothetical protein
MADSNRYGCSPMVIIAEGRRGRWLEATIGCCVRRLSLLRPHCVGQITRAPIHGLGRAQASRVGKLLVEPDETEPREAGGQTSLGSDGHAVLTCLGSKYPSPDSVEFLLNTVSGRRYSLHLGRAIDAMVC